MSLYSLYLCSNTLTHTYADSLVVDRVSILPGCFCQVPGQAKKLVATSNNATQFPATETQV